MKKLLLSLMTILLVSCGNPFPDPDPAKFTQAFQTDFGLSSQYELILVRAEHEDGLIKEHFMILDSDGRELAFPIIEEILDNEGNVERRIKYLIESTRLNPSKKGSDTYQYSNILKSYEIDLEGMEVQGTLQEVDVDDHELNGAYL